MKERIEDIRKRYVFQNYSPPRKTESDIAYLKGRNDGWNDCMAHLKACGKI